MTKTAESILAKPVIKIANKELGLRICYKSSRAVSTIQKMPDGKYVVVEVYKKIIHEYPKYSQAKKAAESAPMLPGRKSAKQAPVTALQVVERSGRAISTIQKMPDGKWMVVELYEERANEFDEHSIALEVAESAAMKQAPRTTKDAA